MHLNTEWSFVYLSPKTVRHAHTDFLDLLSFGGEQQDGTLSHPQHCWSVLEQVGESLSSCCSSGSLPWPPTGGRRQLCFSFSDQYSITNHPPKNKKTPQKTNKKNQLPWMPESTPAKTRGAGSHLRATSQHRSLRPETRHWVLGLIDQYFKS